jgi:hypothetical protein
LHIDKAPFDQKARDHSQEPPDFQTKKHGVPAFPRCAASMQPKELTADAADRSGFIDKPP